MNVKKEEQKASVTLSYFFVSNGTPESYKME